MDFPTKVKVGWATYKIEVWHPAEAVGARRFGESNPISRVIRVDTSYSPQQTAETLLHEIIHCVYTMWDLDDEDKEEKIVSQIGTGLTTVWHDNPEVFAWIAENLK